MKVTPKMVTLTMQRRNVRGQVGGNVRSARRSIFQDEDDDNENSGMEDNLVNCFFEEARKNRENAKARWNFDFEREEPLPGRYVWVKIDHHGNEISNASVTSNGVHDLQDMQDESAQDDDDVTMQEDKGDDKMTDST